MDVPENDQWHRETEPLIDRKRSTAIGRCCMGGLRATTESTRRTLIFKSAYNLYYRRPLPAYEPRAGTYLSCGAHIGTLLDARWFPFRAAALTLGRVKLPFQGLCAPLRRQPPREPITRLSKRPFGASTALVAGVGHLIHSSSVMLSLTCLKMATTIMFTL